MKTREEILEFVKTNDFAYVYGAGLMYATDDEQREYLANIISGMNFVVPVNDLEEEGCGASELKNEEGAVYKCYNSNEEPLYVLVDNIEYRVQDTETGTAVFYKGYNKAKAIKEVIDSTEEGLEVDLYEDGERVWCGFLDCLSQLAKI